MRSGLGRWMKNKPCPPLEDTTVFATDWRASPPPRPPVAMRLVGWLAGMPQGSERDPLGTILRACPGAIDFEMLSRLI